MKCDPCLVLPVIESLQAATCLFCLAINARTLSFARQRYRNVIDSKENHGAPQFVWAVLKQQIVLLFAQVFIFCAGLDRIYLSITRPHLYAVTFLLMGFWRTGTSILIAWCVWSNHIAYQKLREGIQDEE